MRRGEDDPEVTRLLEAASAAIEDGRPEDALAAAEEAARRAPRSVAALHLRAAALSEAGRLDDAADAYQRALDVGKDDVDLLADAADFFVNALQGDDGDRDASERGLELARRGVRAARRAGDDEAEGELAWLEGVALNQLGRCDEALPRLAEAEARLPDSPQIPLERGVALYELCRWREARAALLRAEELAPDDAWVQHHLGLVAERTGDAEEARRRFGHARKLEPREFPKPIALAEGAFDAAVEDALAAVPEQVRRYLANVPITVEDLPSEEDLRGSDPPLSPSLLGMFRGAPYGEKQSMNPWSHLPSGIVLYQRNLERFARSRAELIEEIRITLVHEVGHFLGLDEDELYERGLD